MCLAIPLKLTHRDGVRGTAEANGVARAVMLDLVPEAAVGDYVIVHAGYAIQILDAQAALETLALLADVAAEEP
jgi:hydrogenase expression/formation protein HypC